MLVLDASTKSVVISLAAAPATTQPTFLSSWEDITVTAFTPGSTDGLTTGTTATSIVPAPAASTQRRVKAMNVYNNDSTVATVTIQYNNNATLRKLAGVALQPSEMLTYAAGEWKTMDATGAQKLAQSGTGRWMRTVLLTGGTSHVTGPQTTSIFVRGVGGGGAGGGCTTVAAAIAAAGGGGAGGYCEKTFTVTPSTAYAYTVGSAGSGVVGAAGANGVNSTFVVGGTTVTAGLGTGGPQAVASASLRTYIGGAGGAATNGDVNAPGSAGEYGVTIAVAGTIAASGRGGDSQFGSGGLGLIAAAAGNAATGYGSGGGGSLTAASAGRAGGNGTPGCWVVDEYA